MKTPLTDEIDRLREINKELMDALEHIEIYLTDCRCGQPDICPKCTALRMRKQALDHAKAKGEK